MHPGERIRQFRKSKKLTLQRFGQQIGYSYTYISEVETGKLEPSRELIKKLNKTFGLSADEILYGKPSEIGKSKDYIARVEFGDKARRLAEAAEGNVFIENFVPIPIARGEISAGTPREVEENPEGLAVIYKDWAKNFREFTAIRVKGDSMKPTIPNGSLVGIDHSKRDIKALNGKVVAIRKNGEATLKRLRVISDDLVLGLPDNPEFMSETVILQGEEINTAIVGKAAWWWELQK